MNCFEWQNHSSEFLDETLSGSMQKEAENHVASCKECRERSKHYRLILSSIASQKKATIPAHLDKPPFSLTLSRSELARFNLSRWEGLPWYLRTIIEGIGIVFIIVLGISSAPKVRALYQKSIEQGLTDKEALTFTEPLTEAFDSNLPPLAEKPSISSEPSSSSEELNGEDDQEDDDSNVRVGRSQLWRFTLKTVSPDELRPQVVKALTELGVPLNTPGLGGMQVPGGIEFDLILPQSLVANIKHVLQKLAPKGPGHASGKAKDSDEVDNFSWYKVKSKRKLPEDKSQVVIWLSQPN